MNKLKLLRRALAGAVVLGLCVAAGAAQAQTAEQKKAAKEYFEQARRLYDVGKYQEAIEAYQKAYLNVEDPVFLYNIAQSHRLNNQPEDAIRFYKNYLRRSPDAANKDEVQKKIEDLQKEIDDKARGSNKTAPPPVEPVKPTTTPPPVVEPPPVTPTAAPPVVINTSAPNPEPKRQWRTTGIVLAGVGGALLVTSVVTGSMANKAAKDVEKGPTFDPDAESRGKTLNKVAITTGLLGLAAGITGGVLLFMNGSSSSSPEATAVEPRFALAPVLGGSYTGAQATYRF
ncbi:MAG: tetratricopeptide repeat protein [Deltaproteobacteria bacterium]|nr:tetratricopeptide repeat protein [Deltaproteobacteria bacterium]